MNYEMIETRNTYMH